MPEKFTLNVHVAHPVTGEGSVDHHPDTVDWTLENQLIVHTLSDAGTHRIHYYNPSYVWKIVEIREESNA